MFFPFRFNDFLLNFHVEGIFGLSKIVDSKDDFDNLWYSLVIKVEELFHLLIIVSVCKESFVSALNECDFGRFHSFDGFSEHFRDSVIIKIVFSDSWELI